MTTMMVFSTRKKPVGCARDARLATMRGELEEIGNGLFKRVFLSPDGTVVYKVARGASRSRSDVNHGRERAIIAEVAWIAEGRRRNVMGMPHVTLWSVYGEPVEAMPFVTYSSADGFYSVPYGRKRDALHKRIDVAKRNWYDLGLEDLHSENYRFDSRHRPIVVDLGGWGDSAPLESLPETARDMSTSIYDIPEECDEYCDCDDCMPRDACFNCGETSNWCECGPCDRNGHDYCRCQMCIVCEDCVCPPSPVGPDPYVRVPVGFDYDRAWGLGVVCMRCGKSFGYHSGIGCPDAQGTWEFPPVADITSVGYVWSGPLVMYDGIPGNAICVYCNKSRGNHYAGLCEPGGLVMFGALAAVARIPTRLDNAYDFNHPGKCSLFHGWCRHCNPEGYRAAKAQYGL